MTGERWQLLPPLSESEYAALKSDIAERGVLVAVVIDAETGLTIDGHHRVRAWQELRAEGVKVPDYPRDVRAFASDDERAECVLAANLFRRHLTRAQRAEIVTNLRERGFTIRRIAEALGVGRSTIADDLSIVRDRTISEPERVGRKGGGSYPARRPNVVVTGQRDTERARAALSIIGDDGPGKLLDIRRAEELARKAHMARLRAEHAEAAGTVVRSDAWELRCGDFREVLAGLPDASIDAILTDPPYDDQSIPLWSGLGAVAARVLVPGRLCVAYCGHLRQLDSMRRLAEHLEFVWVGATIQPGRHTIIRSHLIWRRHRPWLVYSAGRYVARGPIDDTIASEGRGEKSATDHHWAQTLGPFRKLVQMVTRPGDLVCDPFAGSGTTGAACLLEG
ncbi:MAG: DNA methyltransferase, partial [Acidimicrobiales bacterium]